MSANFAKDLARGAVGEQIFHNLMPHLQKLGRTADFVCPYTGQTFEVKVDYTSHPNFFFESMSDVAKGKIGGPWRSAQEKTTWFVYLFAKTGQGYITSTRQLVREIEKLQKKEKLRVVSVQNRSWITRGVLVPKDKLAGVGKTFTFEAIA